MIQFDNTVERFGKTILNEMKDAGIKCWIAGGAVRDYFMATPARTDYDMFFPNQEEFDKAKQYFTDHDGEIKYESANGVKFLYDKKRIDVIAKFFDSPQATIDAFDFTVSMFAVDSENVYHGETSFIDLSKRQLMINKLPYPASSLKRAFRYYRKGFLMCVGEMKKLTEAIQDMPKPEPIEIMEGESVNNNSSGDAFFNGID